MAGLGDGSSRLAHRRRVASVREKASGAPLPGTRRFRGARARPVTPSSTISSSRGSRDATTGRPAAWASMMGRAKWSRSAGNTRRSLAARRSPTPSEKPRMPAGIPQGRHVLVQPLPGGQQAQSREDPPDDARQRRRGSRRCPRHQANGSGRSPAIEERAGDQGPDALDLRACRPGRGRSARFGGKPSRAGLVSPPSPGLNVSRSTLSGTICPPTPAPRPGGIAAS